MLSRMNPGGGRSGRRRSGRPGPAYDLQPVGRNLSRRVREGMPVWVIEIDDIHSRDIQPQEGSVVVQHAELFLVDEHICVTQSSGLLPNFLPQAIITVYF